MRKRQFGKGTEVRSSDHNTAENYVELNLRDIALDSKTYGITSGGIVVPALTIHTVSIQSTIARTGEGERVSISTATDVNVQPTTSVDVGKEVWVNVSVNFVPVISESDHDILGNLYYKDYQNSYVLVVTEGTIANTGLAVRPDIPEYAISLCDILYSHALYLSGIIVPGDIDTTRQTRTNVIHHAHTNILELQKVTDGIHSTRLTNPHSTTKDQIGLGNVTDDAQLKKVASSIDGGIPSWDGSSGDLLTAGYTLETVMAGSSTGIPTAYASKYYIDNIISGIDVFFYKGVIDCSVNPFYPAADAGFTYKVSSSGLIGGLLGVPVEVGDAIICCVDGSPFGDQATVGSNWNVLQSNLSGYVSGPITSIDNDLISFSGSTGRIGKDSGYLARDATISQKGFIQLSNLFNGTSELVATTEKALSDGLNLLLSKSSNEFNSYPLKASTGNFDPFLIEQISLSYDKAYVEIQDRTLTVPDTNYGLNTSSGEIYVKLRQGLEFSSSGAINVIPDNVTLYINGSNQLAAVTLAPVDTTRGLIVIDDEVNVHIYTSTGTYGKLAFETSTGKLMIDLEDIINTSGGLYITGDGKIGIKLANSSGLAFSSTGALYLDAGDGLTTSSGKLAVKLGEGLGFGGSIDVLVDDATIEVSSTGNYLKVIDGLYSSTGHTHTTSQVGLGNVTNDAQLTRSAGDFNTFTSTGTASSNSILLLEDASDSYNKKKLQVSNFPYNSIVDSDALHDNTAGEITTLTEKTTLVDDDIFIIEDSADSYNKKKFKKSNIAPAEGGAVSVYVPTTGDVGELSIEDTGYRTITVSGISGILAFNPSNVNAWAATGNLNTARRGLAGCGVQSAALSFGGNTGSASAVTEKFNGSTWSNSGALNTARYWLAGCGIQSAALSAGGDTGSASAVTEKFNGSTWSTNGSWDLNTARYMVAGAGIQSAALSIGGSTGSSIATTEKFNGSAWTASGNLNTARRASAGAGVQSAALSFGGTSTSYSNKTEKFNGSTWIATGNLNTARDGLAGSGTQNSALSFGGTTGTPSVVTEKFNGSTWSTDAGFNLNTGRSGLAGSGIQNSGLSSGGDTGSDSAVTEKFTEPYKLKLQVLAIENTTDDTATERVEIETFESNCSFTIKCPAVISYGIICEREYDTYANKQTGINAGINVLNYGYWITTGNLNVARNYTPFGGGPQNASLATGGYGNYGGNEVELPATEKFNGSTWSTNAGWDLIEGRENGSGNGIQNAFLVGGGYGETLSQTDNTEKFNGSAWSTNSGWNMNTTSAYGAGFGVQNSLVSCGGYKPTTRSVYTEIFNGSSWSYSGNLNTGRDAFSGSGMKNAGLTAGGDTGSASAVTEKFNGNTWSLSGSLVTARDRLSLSGTQNSSRAIGGDASVGTWYYAICERFNGTFWIVTSSLNVGSYALASSGNSMAALAFGGDIYSGISDRTEKFNYNRDISELFTTEDCYVDKSNIQIGY